MPSPVSSEKKAKKRKKEAKKKSSKKKKKQDKKSKERNPQDVEVPLAELLRREHKRDDILESEKQAQDSTPQPEQQPDIDDEIRRLEAELAGIDDDDDESSEEENDEDVAPVKRKRTIRFGENTVREIPSCKPALPSSSEADVICLSTVSEDRIEPLPSTSLPAISRKRNNNDDDIFPSRKKKRKNEPSSDNGLAKVVREVLDGYVARSSEKLPFYCRVCAKQYENLEEFQSHFSGDFHQTAVAMERKASYCKLCRKQLTSPVQLKEHLQSKPHRERLHRVREKQQQTKYRGHRDTGNNSRRQWC